MKQEIKNREPMPSVLKHVMKQNPTMSKEEAVKKALAMEARYDEANKERNEKRNAEYRKEWERALQKENDHWALEMLSGDALAEYFNVIKD
jgi:hypothetical protein|tara:strand:+ start:643 stop:915 length:273 start_codon:yes stop_codon:yes gene_type:complete